MILYCLVLLQLALIGLVALSLFLSHNCEKRLDRMIADLEEQVEGVLAFSAKVAEVQDFCHETRETLHRLIEAAHRERDKARANALLQLRDRVDALEARVVQRTRRLLDAEKNETMKQRRKKNKSAKKT